MSDLNVPIEIRPLPDWPEAALRRVHRLVVANLARLMEMPADAPERVRELEGARADCELFGMEMLRRGLI
jgi:hypothetical protein